MHAFFVRVSFYVRVDETDILRRLYCSCAAFIADDVNHIATACIYGVDGIPGANGSAPISGHGGCGNWTNADAENFFNASVTVSSDKSPRVLGLSTPCCFAITIVYPVTATRFGVLGGALSASSLCTGRQGSVAFNPTRRHDKRTPAQVPSGAESLACTARSVSVHGGALPAVHNAL